MCPRLILFFDESNVSIDLAGGKGVNLAILKRNGFPVPNGFIITTQAYQAFIETNNLAEFIDKQMAGLTFDNYDSIDSASTLIRDRFTTGVMPSELVEQTYQAYEKLNNAPVAVRSSATMEDLPGFSFAGQHDTFLNVITKETLLEAVVKCFSSLWTARVIQYRHRNDVSHKDLSIAVVVQEMVASEASGVLFSANPLTGKRNEVVIEAILGLGEALVSGQVEPDRYTVDIDGRILSKKLGSKSVVIHGSRSGGTLVRTEDARDHPALTDKQIQELAQLGYRVGKYYDSPQDIEWAFTGEKLYLLQARPITSLYPLPSKLSPDPFRILFSFNIIQGLLDPITPLGQDVIQSFLLGVGKIFGYHISFEAQTALWSAAERLWINITPLIRNRFLRQISQKALPVVEPETMHILNSLLDDPQLASNIGLPKLRTLKNFTRIYLVLL
ncbi:MAG: PEP/pyruvate-binding domain-containing protein, partial [Candidatus Hodarchaeota archaeon]